MGNPGGTVKAEDVDMAEGPGESEGPGNLEDPYYTAEDESFSREVRRRLRGKGAERRGGGKLVVESQVIKEEAVKGLDEELAKSAAGARAGAAESTTGSTEAGGMEAYKQTDLYKYFKNCERMDGVRAGRSAARRQAEPY